MQYNKCEAYALHLDKKNLLSRTYYTEFQTMLHPISKSIDDHDATQPMIFVGAFGVIALWWIKNFKSYLPNGARTRKNITSLPCFHQAPSKAVQMNNFSIPIDSRHYAIFISSHIYFFSENFQ